MGTEIGASENTCTYCLAVVPPSQMTNDHVIARSWYSANTPPIEKWKVPACRVCNNRYSAIEKDLLERLAMCLDPKDPAIRHIVQRALRSIDPKMGASYEDVRHRFNRKQAIRGSLKEIHDPRMRGLLPFFRDNFYEGSRTGIEIPAHSLKSLVDKWMRGVHRCEFRAVVARDTEVSVYFVEDKVAAEAFAEIIQHAKRIQKGPGVEVMIWHVEEQGQSVTAYAFQIWKQFRVYGYLESIDQSPRVAGEISGADRS